MILSMAYTPPTIHSDKTDVNTIVEVNDPVNHPAHYTEHPSGIECIEVTEHMNFNIGNAIKYLWRCDLKHDAIEDLKKVVWYVQREISRREKALATKKARLEVSI